MKQANSIVPGGITARAQTALGEVQTQEFRESHRIPKHFHAAPYISFVTGGAYVEEGGAGEVSCRRGDIILHGPNETHSNTFAADSRVLSLFLSPDGDGASKKNLSALKSAVVHLPGVQISFQKIARELSARDSFSDIIVEGAAFEIFGEVLRALTGGRDPSGRDIARKTLELLNDHDDAPLGLSEVARILGVEASHLAKSFKRETGQTVGEYQRRVRVEKARALLTGTTLPICEVALEAGFYDQSHLTRTFKKTTGATPLEFRKVFTAGGHFKI